MSYPHSKSRVEAFSDSVFAFAATLLVVSLEVPDSFELLQQNLKGFLSFGITFFALAMIWKVHYNFFRRVEKIDNGIIAANITLLFTVLFFVYPLKFLVSIAAYQRGMSLANLATVFLLYGLGFLMVFICIAFMYWWAAKIESEAKKKQLLRFYFRHFSIFSFVGLTSVLLAYANVGIQFGVPGFVYALLGPLCFWHGKKWGPDQPASII